MVRTWGVLYILTWKCVSRHSDVQFFFYCSAPAVLASLLFDPPEPRTIAKNTTIRDFTDISRVRIFLVTLLSSDAIDSSSFLCFSTVHTVGSQTFKLPSIINIVWQDASLSHVCVWFACFCGPLQYDPVFVHVLGVSGSSKPLSNTLTNQIRVFSSTFTFLFFFCAMNERCFRQWYKHFFAFKGKS